MNLRHHVKFNRFERIESRLTDNKPPKSILCLYIKHGSTAVAIAHSTAFFSKGKARVLKFVYFDWGTDTSPALEEMPNSKIFQQCDSAKQRKIHTNSSQIAVSASIFCFQSPKLTTVNATCSLSSFIIIRAACF